jgi:hypothetical protein
MKHTTIHIDRPGIWPSEEQFIAGALQDHADMKARVQQTIEQIREAGLRTKLKALGYNCSFKTSLSPFDGKPKRFVTLIMPDKGRILITKSTTLGCEFYEQHKAAFNLCGEFYEKRGD